MKPTLVGIFGAGRNGSTLLMRLLDGSPDLWVYPIELNYFIGSSAHSLKARIKRAAHEVLPAAWMAGRYRRGFHDWVARQLAELQATYLDHLEQPLRLSGNPLDAITARTGNSVESDLPDFLTAVQATYDDRQPVSPPMLVFKSTEVARLDRYEAMFPAMKFVHIVRHPYSNYSSLKRTDMVLKRKPFWFQGGDILRMQLESRWLPHARLLLRRREEQPDRHYIVRYEDICASAADAVTGICEWLGAAVPEHPALQTVLGGKRMKELPQNPSQAGVRTPTSVVSNMAAEFGYEDVLTERERDLIRFRTYDLARRLGYFQADEDAVLPNRFALLRKWMAPDQWEYMNAPSGVRRFRAIVARRLYLCRALLLPAMHG